MIGYAASAAELSAEDLYQQIDDAAHLVSDLEDGKDTQLTRMWVGHTSQACVYGAAMCHEFRITRRIGENAGRVLKYANYFAAVEAELKSVGEISPKPPWLGDLWVHRSHRSKLIAKEPFRNGGHYMAKWGASTPVMMAVLWPQLIKGGGYRLRVDDENPVLPPELYYDHNKREVLECN